MLPAILLDQSPKGVSLLSIYCTHFNRLFLRSISFIDNVEFLCSRCFSLSITSMCLIMLLPEHRMYFARPLRQRDNSQWRNNSRCSRSGFFVPSV